jgi:hypothetical protein
MSPLLFLSLFVFTAVCIPLANGKMVYKGRYMFIEGKKERGRERV